MTEIKDIYETSEGGREATVKIYTGYGDGCSPKRN